MSKLNIAGGAIALLAAIVPMQGQTLATGPGDFMVERILALSGVMAPVPPNLPAGVLGGIQAGAIEIHQRLTYKIIGRSITRLAVGKLGS